MSIIQLALLALAALAVIVIIILFVSKRKRDDVPTETSMDSVEDDTPLRRRPDFGVFCAKLQEQTITKRLQLLAGSFRIRTRITSCWLTMC